MELYFLTVLEAGISRSMCSQGGFWWGFFSWLVDGYCCSVTQSCLTLCDLMDCTFLLCIHHGLSSVFGNSWCLFVFFIRISAPLIRTLPSWPHLILANFLKTLSPNQSHWGLGFDIWFLGRQSLLCIRVYIGVRVGVCPGVARGVAWVAW